MLLHFPSRVDLSLRKKIVFLFDSWKTLLWLSIIYLINTYTSLMSNLFFLVILLLVIALLQLRMLLLFNNLVDKLIFIWCGCETFPTANWWWKVVVLLLANKLLILLLWLKDHRLLLLLVSISWRNNIICIVLNQVNHLILSLVICLLLNLGHLIILLLLLLLSCSESRYLTDIWQTVINKFYLVNNIIVINNRTALIGLNIVFVQIQTTVKYFLNWWCYRVILNAKLLNICCLIYWMRIRV